MNGQAHANIMAAAFEALPTSWRDRLEPVRPLLPRVGNYPDYFDDPNAPESRKVEIDPDWRRFTQFPPDMAGPNLHRWPHPKTRQDQWRPMIEYWMNQALECLKQGDDEGFIKFLGCLSHMEGDITQSAHLIDLQLLEELVPPPEHWPGFHYHTDLEAVTGESGPLEAPHLLGTSIPEAAWRLGAIHLRDMAHCRRYIVPILQALFSRDEAAAIHHAGPPVTYAAQNTLDIAYTLLSLADQRFDAQQRDALACVDLRTWSPDEQKHDSVYGSAILDGNRGTPPSGAPIVPTQLRFADGDIRPVQGLGMLPHSGMSGPRDAWMRFSLPRGVFARFESVIGMAQPLTRDGAADFVVELDGEEVFRSGRRTTSDIAQPISIALADAEQLTIKVEDANDGRTFWNNHAYWGEPRLVKDE